MSRPRISRQGEPCAAPNKVLVFQPLDCERRGQVVRYSTNTRTIHSFGCPVYAWSWALTARASHTHSSRPRVSSRGDYCAFDALATSFVAYLASINLMRKEDDFSETGTCGRSDSHLRFRGIYPRTRAAARATLVSPEGMMRHGLKDEGPSLDSYTNRLISAFPSPCSFPNLLQWMRRESMPCLY